MGLLTNVLVTVLCIDIMLFVGGATMTGPNQNICFDLLGTFITTSNNNTMVAPNGNFTGALPTSTEQGTFGSTTSTATFSFIDGLKMVFAAILFPLAVAFAPLCTGYALGFPLWLIMVVCVPLTFGTIFGFIYLIRGIMS